MDVLGLRPTYKSRTMARWSKLAGPFEHVCQANNNDHIEDMHLR